MTLRETIAQAMPGATVREIPEGLQIGGFSCPPVEAQQRLRDAGLLVRDLWGATVVIGERCFCPDDCNCRQPHRVNYCGCRRHQSDCKND
jgi:hypothetical protein